MWKYFLCLMSMLLTLTAWGCSLAPQPVARPVTGQQTLEAADHWRILAQQIVKEMQPTIGGSVYVSEQDRSPFGRAFKQPGRTAENRNAGGNKEDTASSRSYDYNRYP